MDDIKYIDFDEAAVKQSVIQKIRDYWESKDKSQADLVRETNIQQSVLSAIMNGKQLLSLRNAYLIAGCLGITIDELVGLSMRGSTDLTIPGIAKTIVDWVNAGRAQIRIEKITEFAPPPPPDTTEDDIPDYELYDYFEQEIEYPMIYFSPYAQSAYGRGGNLPALNAFLSTLESYAKLFYAGEIDSTDFQTLVSKRLQMLTEQSKKQGRLAP